jgi:4-amino-4-deoxy-L-arabinose transferase-like glycosyltransferase
MGWVFAALACYGVGFALFWPKALMVSDEERYVSQALAFSQGNTEIDRAELIRMAPRSPVISDYPPGTSMLQAPFVRLFGWRGAAVVSLLSLIAATLLTARWLTDAALNPAFALYVPAFMGSLLFGRFAMSDLPSTAVVALFFMALWRAGGVGRRSMSALAGFACGAVLLFREPPVLIMAPFLIGAGMRREISAAAAAAGFVGGLALRLMSAAALFGTPWYIRDPGAGFSLGSATHTAPIYAVMLLLLVPGAVLLPFLYRGSRRAEFVIAFASYVGLFVFFDFDGVRTNGLLKGFLHTSRYLCPLLPLIAFMGAAVWPPIFERFAARGRLVRAIPGALGAAIALGAFAVHPVISREEQNAITIVRGIAAHVAPTYPVVTNTNATLKYLSPAYGARQLIPRYGLSPDSVATYASQYGGLGIALLNRFDSERFTREAAENDLFITALGERCTLRATHDTTVKVWGSLRVFALETCR